METGTVWVATYFKTALDSLLFVLLFALLLFFWHEQDAKERGRSRSGKKKILCLVYCFICGVLLLIRFFCASHFAIVVLLIPEWLLLLSLLLPLALSLQCMRVCICKCVYLCL